MGGKIEGGRLGTLGLELSGYRWGEGGWETGTKELNGISKLVQDQFKAIEMDATSMATPFKNN